MGRTCSTHKEMRNVGLYRVVRNRKERVRGVSVKTILKWNSVKCVRCDLGPPLRAVAQQWTAFLQKIRALLYRLNLCQFSRNTALYSETYVGHVWCHQKPPNLYRWPTYRKSYFPYDYIYIHSFNNYPNRIIILHTSTDRL
jgi:hypothetical protein